LGTGLSRRASFGSIVVSSISSPSFLLDLGGIATLGNSSRSSSASEASLSGTSYCEILDISLSISLLPSEGNPELLGTAVASLLSSLISFLGNRSNSSSRSSEKDSVRRRQRDPFLGFAGILVISLAIAGLAALLPFLNTRSSLIV
jgi:hypothetical protein